MPRTGEIPTAHLQYAMSEAFDALDSIDDDAGVIDRMEAEQDAMESWAEGAARAIDEYNAPEPRAEAGAKALSMECEWFRKMDLVPLVAEKRGQD